MNIYYLVRCFSKAEATWKKKQILSDWFTSDRAQEGWMAIQVI